MVVVQLVPTTVLQGVLHRVEADALNPVEVDALHLAEVDAPNHAVADARLIVGMLALALVMEVARLLVEVLVRTDAQLNV